MKCQAAAKPTSALLIVYCCYLFVCQCMSRAVPQWNASSFSHFFPVPPENSRRKQSCRLKFLFLLSLQKSINCISFLFFSFSFSCRTCWKERQKRTPRRCWPARTTGELFMSFCACQHNISQANSIANVLAEYCCMQMSRFLCVSVCLHLCLCPLSQCSLSVFWFSIPFPLSRGFACHFPVH